MSDATSEPIRVLVVDDHPLLREGIAAVVGREAGMVVVAEAGSGAEAIEQHGRHRPDVTLMDLQMPEQDGIATMQAIRTRLPDARFLVLTTYGGDAQVLRALRAGAGGYLLKSTIRKELVEAIRAVHAGRQYITGEVAREIAAHVMDEALSLRELEVLRCVSRGLSNRRVALELGVTEDTVKTHMKNIMGKLGADDRTHAVTIALRRGVIEV